MFQTNIVPLDGPTPISAVVSLHPTDLKSKNLDVQKYFVKMFKTMLDWVY